MLNNVRLNVRLVLYFLLVGLIPMLIVSIVSLQKSRAAIEERTKEQLVSLRELKASQIEDYFATLRQQVVTFSDDLMVIEAMKEFKGAFGQVGRDGGGGGPVDPRAVQQYRDQLRSYYTADFSDEYQKRNEGRSPDAESIVDRLDDESVVLQYSYIKANPNPLGSKDALERAEDGSRWSAVHEKYHPHLRHFLKEFGYYDIFLVDAESGDIVYTVFKELDFSTSLKNGPYASSGLGQVFAEVSAARERDYVAVSDFQPYRPSYEDQAGFIGSPVFDGQEMIGVLIFQLPIDRINGVMTSDQEWRAIGLGGSGETYLVGADRRMRSQSRFLLEDPEAYLEAIEASGVDAETAGLIRAKQSSIGLHVIETSAAREALAGRSAVELVDDYRGVRVLSAYAPLEIPGLDWAILAEFDEEEAFAAATALQWFVVVISLILMGVVVLVGWLAARSISRPVSAIAAVAERISLGDVDQRIDIFGKDEIGILAEAFRKLIDYMKRLAAVAEKVAQNDLTMSVQPASDKDVLGLSFRSMIENLTAMIHRLQEAVRELASAAHEIATASEQMSLGAKNQAEQIAQVSAAVEEMSANIIESSKHAEEASTASRTAAGTAGTGGQVVTQSIAGMQRISEVVRQSAESIAKLATSADQIGEITKVIDDIADQTNLLALNAAIEAARAGDQGRGFAVVADEVRKLAERTGKATGEITEMIKGIQTETEEAVVSMEQGMQEVDRGRAMTDKAGVSLSEIVEISHQVMEMIQQMSSATQQQSGAAEEVSRNIEHISSVTRETAAGSEQSASAAEELNRQADELRKIIESFQLAAR